MMTFHVRNRSSLFEVQRGKLLIEISSLQGCGRDELNDRILGKHIECPLKQELLYQKSCARTSFSQIFLRLNRSRNDNNIACYITSTLMSHRHCSNLYTIIVKTHRRRQIGILGSYHRYRRQRCRKHRMIFQRIFLLYSSIQLCC